jgi:hypothetical protein
MLSGDNIGDSGESKGVVLWRLDRLFYDLNSPYGSPLAQIHARQRGR